MKLLSLNNTYLWPSVPSHQHSNHQLPSPPTHWMELVLFCSHTGGVTQIEDHRSLIHQETKRNTVRDTQKVNVFSVTVHHRPSAALCSPLPFILAQSCPLGPAPRQWAQMASFSLHTCWRKDLHLQSSLGCSCKAETEMLINNVLNYILDI